MLTKQITFDDWDGNTVTETHNFHLTAAELLELDLQGSLRMMIEAKNDPAVMKEVKKIILTSVGRRDGKFFEKSDQISKEFEMTGAYSALLVEIGTSADAAVEFVKGILPKDVTPANFEEIIRQAQAGVGATETPAQPQPTSRTAELAAAQNDTSTPAPVPNEAAAADPVQVTGATDTPPAGSQS